MRRIELTSLTNNAKVIIQVALLAAFTKLPPKEGSGMFSGGTKVLLSSGRELHVRDFYSVVDFLISRASAAPQEECGTAFSYFAGEDLEADEAYKLFKTLSNRDVQTPQETEAQTADKEAAVF